MEVTGNENVSNFGAIVAMQYDISSETRNSISPYPVAKFLRVSRGSERHVFLVSFGKVSPLY